MRLLENEAWTQTHIHTPERNKGQTGRLGKGEELKNTESEMKKKRESEGEKERERKKMTLSGMPILISLSLSLIPGQLEHTNQTGNKYTHTHVDRPALNNSANGQLHDAGP